MIASEEDSNEWQETENERIKVYERTKALLSERKHILITKCTEFVQKAYDEALSAGYGQGNIKYMLRDVVNDVDARNEDRLMTPTLKAQADAIFMSVLAKAEYVDAKTLTDSAFLELYDAFPVTDIDEAWTYLNTRAKAELEAQASAR